MKLSICIPTYNRCKHLRNCLESIVSNQIEENRWNVFQKEKLIRNMNLVVK